MLTLLNIVLAVVTFILAVPIRASIVVLKIDIARMEHLSGGKRLLKNRLLNAVGNVARNNVYVAKVALLASLKLLLGVLRLCSRLAGVLVLFGIICIFLLLGVLASSTGFMTMGNDSSTENKVPVSSVANVGEGDDIDSGDSVISADASEFVDFAIGFNRAREQSNVHYIYGGAPANIKGYGRLARRDCSGFVCSAINLYYKDKAGIGWAVPTSSMQTGFSTKYWKKVAWVSWGKLQRGDIIVWNGHTEIFYGNYDGMWQGKKYGDSTDKGFVGIGAWWSNGIHHCAKWYPRLNAYRAAQTPISIWRRK